MISDFFTGFLVLFRGIGIIFKSKKMMTIAAGPILLGILVLFAFAFFLLPQFGYFQSTIEAFFVQLFGIATQNTFVLICLHSLAFLLVLAFAFLSVYFLFLITKLLASPLYGLLANQVFKERGLKMADDLSVARWMYLNFRSTAVNIIEVLVFSVLGAILFVVSFIPVVNVLAAFGFFLIMAYDSADYSFDLLNLKLSERIKYFVSHLAQFCGFALAISLVMLIPVVNLIVFASSVAGAADLVARNLKDLKNIEPR